MIPFSTLPGWDLAGPASEAWSAEATFEHGSLAARKWRLAPVRPSEILGPVVGRENEQGVVVEAIVLEFLHDRADDVVELRHTGLVDGPAVLRRAQLIVFLGEVGDDVHARRVEPAEERLATSLGPVDELHGVCQDLVIDGLHPIWIECARVLDPLLADLAPTRLDGRIVLVGRPAVQHVAWADLVDESRWVVGMRRVFHSVEVIEIAEKLFKAVKCGQIFVEIAQVILSELARRVAHRLESGSNGGCFGRYPNFRARLADSSQTGSDRQLSGDEVGSTGRATRLRVVVGKAHALGRHSVEVRRAIMPW
jgi:hypothetical protein